MSLYSRLDRLAADVEKLNKQVTAVSNQPQSQRISVEGGGSFDFNDADGNLMAVVGGQDDGSNTIRHVDGPTPPIPSGLSAHVDGPIVQVSWDGTFESDVTHDWHYLEVLAVGPNNEQLTGTINDLSGGETSLAATSQGDWFITARSVSRAGKRSLDGDAGTASVQLVGLTGAIDAVQESANGKSTIYYSPTEPVAPEGGFSNGDLWFDTSEEGNNTASVWDGNGWVSMEDARLATIIAAQEALESDLQDVQTSVDGKNTITYDPALPPASYVGAVGDTWYRTSGNSMIGFWKWDGAAWIQQELSTTVIPQIDIGAGTFGSLAGSRLEVGSVTADKVLIGGSDNLVVNPTFENDAAGWSYNAAGNATDQFGPMEGVGRSGGAALAATGPSGDWYAMSQEVPVEPGEYLMTVWVKSSVDIAPGVEFMLTTIRPTLVNGSQPWITSPAADRNVGLSAGVWKRIQSVFTMPADGMSTFFRVGSRAGLTAGTLIMSDVSVVRRSGATLIENGAITTDKLAVGSITAESGIIESLDLGTATVGELDGIRIMGQSIRGEQLSGDAIDGKVITGGTYRTTGGTGSWSDAGLFIAQPDGTSMVRFPTDGSPLSLTASDVQIERASIGDLDVSYGAVRSGGEFTLASGVTAPPSPPELSAGWKFEAQLPRPAEPSMDWTGLAYWNGLYVRGVNVLGSAGDSADRIELYSPDGTLNRSINIDLNPRAGVAVIGDIVYTIGPDHVAANKGKQWCHGFDLNTGARVSRWEYVHFFASNQKKIAIGVDGSNLMVAGVAPDVVLSVFKYNPTTGAVVGSQMSTPFDVGYAADIYGVGTSGGKIYVSPRGQVREYTVSGSTLTKTAGFAWDNPNWNSGGFTFVGGVPVVVDSGDVYEGSTAAAGATSELCYTWYDGQHETTPSPVATVTSRAREVVTVSLPIRSGVRKRLYSRGVGGGSWARAEIPENVSVFPRPTGFANYAPPTVNTFPNSTPAVMKSSAGNFEVKGDGSGHWGPLTFNTDGSMTGMRRMAAGRVSIAVTDQQKGYETATVQFPTGLFTSPPAVTTGANSTNTALMNVGVLSVTVDQATISVRRTTTTPTVVDWIATEID